MHSILVHVRCVIAQIRVYKIEVVLVRATVWLYNDEGIVDVAFLPFLVLQGLLLQCVILVKLNKGGVWKARKHRPFYSI